MLAQTSLASRLLTSSWHQTCQTACLSPSSSLPCHRTPVRTSGALTLPCLPALPCAQGQAFRLPGFARPGLLAPGLQTSFAQPQPSSCPEQAPSSGFGLAGWPRRPGRLVVRLALPCPGIAPGRSNRSSGRARLCLQPSQRRAAAVPGNSQPAFATAARLSRPDAPPPAPYLRHARPALLLLAIADYQLLLWQACFVVTSGQAQVVRNIKQPLAAFAFLPALPRQSCLGLALSACRRPAGRLLTVPSSGLPCPSLSSGPCQGPCHRTPCPIIVPSSSSCSSSLPCSRLCLALTCLALFASADQRLPYSDQPASQQLTAKPHTFVQPVFCPPALLASGRVGPGQAAARLPDAFAWPQRFVFLCQCLQAFAGIRAFVGQTTTTNSGQQPSFASLQIGSR